MEAGTDCLHPRQPKIANAMRTQILGPKASITAAAMGSLRASVSNCDKTFDIFHFISTHCDFQMCGIYLFLY